MRLVGFRTMLVIAAAIMWFTRLNAATPAAPTSAARPAWPLAGASLAPVLRAAADRDHVSTVVAAPIGEQPREGDATVAWIGATDGKATRQWLIQIRRGTATEAELAGNRKSTKTKYLSWGPVVSFKSDPQALDLWIAGPVVTSNARARTDAAPVKRVRVLVPGDYLRLGLDRSLRVDEHIRNRVTALRNEDPHFNVGQIYSLESSIGTETIARAKPVAEKIGFTTEMERAWVGGYVALESFFNLVNDVPDIEAIAAIAVDRPSVWKLAKLATGTQFRTTFGGPGTRPIDPAKFGLVPVTMDSLDTQFAFAFGDDLIVSGGMVVTSPMPPFDTVAGVIALIARHPKNVNRQVQIVILNGSLGTTNVH